VWYHLEEEILRSAGRRISEFETYSRAVRDENARRLRRTTGRPPILRVKRPETWELGPGHDPFHVRSKSASIAHAVRQRLKTGTYEPRRPAGFFVSKPGGGHRLVSSFEIVDEVVSLRLFRSLMKKNRAFFSARAYAYRNDRSPHDAITHVAQEFGMEQRVFVAEYDFTKFFDRISHEHLFKTIEDYRLSITPLEKRLLSAFLRTSEPFVDAVGRSEGARRRIGGIPQGTSVSLFLANLAASGLDRSLERLSVGFVRYADDTLVWRHSYSEITEAVDALHAEAARIGSPINMLKSEGVRLLVPEGTSDVEMRSTPKVAYLGHEISLRQISLKPASVRRLKTRVQQLIFANLVREPISGTQNLSRLTDLDRDYVTFIWQLRRYLYGPLSEVQVRRFQHGGVPAMTFQGAMSYFPLVNDTVQLREFDTWLASQVWLAVRKRQKILMPLTSRRPLPWNLDRLNLIHLTTVSSTTGAPVDLRLPSLGRIARAIQVGVETHGLGVVDGAQDPYLYTD